MFLPISDEPNPKNFTAWVTYGLIAANVLIYVLFTLPLGQSFADGSTPGLEDYLIWLDREAGLLRPGLDMQTLIDKLGIEAVQTGLAEQGLFVTGWDIAVFEHGYRPSTPQIADLFSSMFMHAGFMHLAGNMLFLWIYGDNVEQRLGRLGYLVTYLLTGVAATLAFAIFASGSGTPLVGASGAISGVLGLYFVLFAHNRVRVLIWLGFFVTTILLPARLVLGIYVLIDNLLPFVAAAQTNVAYGAHLGGFLAGALIAWAGDRLEWHAPGFETRERKRHGPQVISMGPPRRSSLSISTVDRAPDPSTAQGIDAAVAAGNPDRAIFQYVNSRPQDHDLLGTNTIAVLGEWLSKRGMATSASKLVRRRIRKVEGPLRARLLLTLARIRRDQGLNTSAYQILIEALESRPDPELERTIRSEVSQISH